MDTILINSKNKKSDPHRLLINLLDKVDLKNSDKYAAFSTLSIYNTWENIKKPYKNNEFKVSAPIWKEEFELPDGSGHILY